jgi:hypothetical protein
MGLRRGSVLAAKAQARHSPASLLQFGLFFAHPVGNEVASMSDARWIEIQANVASAVKHFTDARRFYDVGASARDDDMQQMAAMAFMHAMLAGHTSLEESFKRIMGLVDEEPPVGENWHADIVKRMSLPLEGLRPAFLTADLLPHVQQTRKFRHVAVQTYDDFNWNDAKASVESADIIARSIAPAFERFQVQLDPPRNDDGGRGAAHRHL